MESVVELTDSGVSTVRACEALAVPRATFYRHHSSAAAPEAPEQPPQPRRSHRALTDAERAQVLEILHSDRFVDCAPRQVFATLLEEGTYLCSIRTMYRILEAQGEVQERRNQLTHPKFAAPALEAAAPNEIWSWDITKVKGPTKWSFFHLYVILDIFSRYVVGWMIADREDAELARELIRTTCDRQNIRPDQLTLHSDRGPSMTSKTVAQLLTDLGVDKSHSRPRVSNDNAFSEAQFKTLKYHPDFPDSFASLAESRAFFGDFFDWYNHDHKHTGLELFSPADVHYGRVPELLAFRQQALDAAFQRNPERFSRPPIARAPAGPVRLGPVNGDVITLPIEPLELRDHMCQEAM